MVRNRQDQCLLLDFWDKHKYQVCSFILLWGIGIIISVYFSEGLCNGTSEYYWGDAGDYWRRGLSIWQGEHISLLNMDGFRGYVYPLYCGICSAIAPSGGSVWIFSIVNSLLISLWWTFFIPVLHEQNISGKRSLLASVLCYSVFNLFFYGLSVYPLTDIFTMIICTAGIVCLLKINKECCIWKGILYCFLLGGLSYLAYNVRTIYMFAGLWLFLNFLISLFKSSLAVWKRLALFFCNLVGIVIAALPQLYMNDKQLGIFSMKVPTEGLMLKQLYWGILYQRYDTYLPLSSVEHAPQIYFMDPVGGTLLAKEGISGFLAWKDFFAFVLKHPFDVAGIYMRHLVNSLFPCWPNQYVTEFDNNKILTGLLAYLCIFLFGVAAYRKCFKGKIIANYLPLLIPCIFILPGAVEARYMAVVYIIMLGVLCYNVDWSNMLAYAKTNKLRLAVLFCLFGGGILAIWTSMLASEMSYKIFLTML